MSRSRIQECLTSEYESKGNPVMNMDVKKELIDNFSRGEELYAKERVHVNDHDFKSLADGIVILRTLYDLKLNTGYASRAIAFGNSIFR